MRSSGGDLAPSVMRVRPRCQDPQSACTVSFLVGLAKAARAKVPDPSLRKGSVFRVYGASEHRSSEVRTGERCVSEFRVSEICAAENRASEIRAGQDRAVELRATEDRVAEVRAS